MKNQNKHIPFPPEHTQRIAKHPEFLKNIPRIDATSADPEKMTTLERGKNHAIKLGALAVADSLKQERGKNNPESQLYMLTGQLNEFYEAQLKVDEYRNQYSNNRHDNGALDTERSEYKHNTATIRDFNETLKETINVVGNTMSFNDLYDFLKGTSNILNSKGNKEYMQNVLRSTMIGMRNEVAYEQILIAADIEYENGDVDTDAKGGDFIIHGVPVDLKTSQTGVERARENAARYGNNPYAIVHSHIQHEDYNGALTLPFDVVDEKVDQVRADIQLALSHEHAYAA